MPAIQYVLIPRQRIKPSLVIKILEGKVVISPSRATFVGEEEILRHRVGFVPGPGEIVFVLVHAPANTVFNRVSGQVLQGGIGGLLEDRQRLWILHISMGVKKPQKQLVVAVG